MAAADSSAFQRQLGTNELFCKMCHDVGNLNVLCGLTLLTRHSVDEGLMKCALQEFQHMYPQLTSRIQPNPIEGGAFQFVPMECPTFPLDSDFTCKDMLHDKFQTDTGPLWRVQLVTEASLDKASLDFGPELGALLEDDCSLQTRWRHFLRYFQGKVNQSDLSTFDDEEEGFRSFILFAFHPAITDTLGAFHMLRQFLVILDATLEQDTNAAAAAIVPREDIHQPIERLLPQNEAGFRFGDLVPMAKMISGFMMPRRSPFEKYVPPRGSTDARTHVLRGWLSVEQTNDLLALMEEDDVSLHGVMLAAGLVAMARVLRADESREYPPSESAHLRATNEANLRLYCPGQPRVGCLTTYYEADHVVPPITDKTEFWRFAHELTLKVNSAKGSREPLKNLRIYSKMMSLAGSTSNGSDQMFKDMAAHKARLQNELGVAVYGDLCHVFRRGELASSSAAASAFPSLETWNRPLSGSDRNLRLEDVFHAVAAQDMGSPVTHTAHILHKRLNYVMLYHTTYVSQTQAFMIRDEVVNILRMSTDPME